MSGSSTAPNRLQQAIRVAAVVLLLTGTSPVVPASAAPTRSEGSARSAQTGRSGKVTSVVTVRSTSPSRTSKGTTKSTTRSGNSARTNSTGRTTSSRNLVTYYWRASREGCFLGRRSGSGYRGGIRYEYVRVDHSRRPPREEVIDAECRDPARPPQNLRRSTPPPRPSPPSVSEITRTVETRINSPRLAVSPAARVGGVTGLQTYFWYEGQSSVTATASIRGYTTRATMRPVAFRWATGDGGRLSASRPGSSRSPAAVWVYERTGRYLQRLDVTWEGTWSFSGHGASAAGTLDRVTATTTQRYDVDEIRGELRESS